MVCAGKCGQMQADKRDGLEEKRNQKGDGI